MTAVFTRVTIGKREDRGKSTRHEIISLSPGAGWVRFGDADLMSGELNRARWYLHFRSFHYSYVCHGDRAE
jgi:hypothetical protein